MTGYNETNPRDILSALVREYGRITGDELEANQECLKTPWNPDTPIEPVFRNGSECQRLALNGYDPISDSQYIQGILATIKQSGILASDIRDWKKLPEREKTVAWLKQEFKRADRLHHQEKLTMHKSLAPTPLVHMANAAISSAPTALIDWKYCWAHGLNRTYESHECTSQGQGHIPTATFSNWEQHGGNHTMQRPPFFKQRHKYPDKPNRGRPNKRHKHVPATATVTAPKQE